MLREILFISSVRSKWVVNQSMKISDFIRLKSKILSGNQSFLNEDEEVIERSIPDNFFDDLPDNFFDDCDEEQVLEKYCYQTSSKYVIACN